MTSAPRGHGLPFASLLLGALLLVTLRAAASAEEGDADELATILLPK